MDRRTALKNLTLGMGYTVAAPTIMNILASCTDQSETWTANFLSEEEKHMVTHLSDVMLPTDELPGAIDVNIPQFIDQMYHNIETDSKKEVFRMGASYLAEAFLKTHQKPVLEGTKQDFQNLVGDYFDISDEASKKIMREQHKTLNTVSNERKETYCIYKFLLSVRYHTIFGYCTSEEVGENVLAYDPVPGVYNGCISLEDATNGRAWSL